MQDEANEYVPSMIKQQFYTRNDLPSAPQGYENALALTSTQTGIVERLIENLMYDIGEASETAYKSAENFLTLGRLEADKFRMLTLEEVAKLEAEGKGWNTIQRQMAAKLEAKGITSFVDKAGRQWGLTQYCSMATRTTQRQAQVAAALTEDDWDLWQISKIGSTCPLCSVYEGRVYSKSGTDPDYPPLTMAFGKIDPSGINDLSNTYLNIHPNCLHTLMRYTTAGKTPEQVQRDKDFSSFEKRPANEDYRSKKQINAYRQKENARAEYRRNMKQFKEYQAGLGKDFPKTFETFEKHKKLNDDVYKGWEKKFRELNRNAKEVENQLEDDIIKNTKGLSLSEQKSGDFKGLSETDAIKGNEDMKAFGETLLDNLGANMPVKIVSTLGENGFCGINGEASDIRKICHYDSYNLNKDDPRSSDYRVKTAFHESYHAMLDGRPWDAIDRNWKSQLELNEDWRKIEETFAESSAHYLAKEYGITKKLAPSYPYELTHVLPKLRRLDSFSDCSTIQDFGKKAFEARKAGQDGLWKKLSKQIKKVKLPDDYQTQYFGYIREHENELYDMIVENEPERLFLKTSKETALERLHSSMNLIENNGIYPTGTNDVYYKFLANAMQMIGVK